MSYIDISGLDKSELVKRLYSHAAPLGMGFLHAKAGGLDDKEADELSDEPWLDYIHGRPLKLSVKDDRMRTDLYNRDNGNGMAERIVSEMRDGIGVTEDSSPAREVLNQSEALKLRMISSGLIPDTCRLPSELLIVAQMMDGDPCLGCNHDRSECGGRPKR